MLRSASAAPSWIVSLRSRARCAFSFSLVVLAFAWSVGEVGAQLTPVAPGAAQAGGPTTIKTLPRNNAIRVGLDQPTVVRFSNPVDTATVDGQSIVVTSGGLTVATSFRFSLNRSVVSVTYPNFLPANATVEVRVHGDLIRDTLGALVDADGDGSVGGTGIVRFSTGSALDPPTRTGFATIVGRVVDTRGRPIQGARIRGFDWPRDEHNPHQVPPAISSADGSFSYQTKLFTGQADFVIEITKIDNSRNPPLLYSESLRRVQPLAGGCERVEEALLQELAPREMVTRASGGTLRDPAGLVELEIPPMALQQDSMIGVTVLDSAEHLREELPPLVARAGCFVDVAGVFGEQTDMPVTMRFPNEYGLPAGTRVPFGKVDHNTLQWSDLRDVYTGGGNPPDSFLGRVTADGVWIEIQFDHFCSICTGYCLPYPTPDPDDPPPPPPPDPPCDPNSDNGNSSIDRREGFLREEVELPRFKELESDFGLTLGYFSGGAAPSVTLQSQVDYGSTRPVERTVYRFRVEGLEVEAAYEQTRNRVRPVGTWIWDGRDVLGQQLPTGSYPYELVVQSLNAQTAVAVPDRFGNTSIRSFTQTYPGLTVLSSEIQEGRAVVINLQDSPYGAGWRLLEEPRLYFDSDSAIVLLEGNSNWTRFEPDPNTVNLWAGPGHDSSTMVFNPNTGGFLRTFPDGEQHVFGRDGSVERIVDRFGAQIRFERDNGLLTRVVSRTGYTYDFAYDGRGKLASITDSVNRTTAITVDVNGDLVALTDAAGSSRSFQYDAAHRLIGQVQARGERSEYVYQNGRISHARAFDTDGTTLLRERRFAPSSVQGEIGRALANGFGTLDTPIPAVGDRVDLVVDGRGEETVHVVGSNGLTSSVRDALGNTTSYVYNANGLLESLTRPNGWRTTYQYDADGNVVLERDYEAVNTLRVTRTFEHNAVFDQVSRAVDEEGKQSLFRYDVLGNLLEVEDHDQAVTRYFYEDPRFPNLQTRAVGPLGERTYFQYDVHGNVESVTTFPDPATAPNGRATMIGRDRIGNAISITDPLGHQTQFTYDAFNRVATLRNHLTHTLTFDYGSQGCGCSTPNLTTVTFPNQATIRYEYDGLNRLVRRTDQLGRSSVFAYDPEGNLLATTNRVGQTVQYAYDAVGHLVSKLLPGGELTVYEYDQLGKLVAMDDPLCSLTYVRDFYGRMTSATTVLDLPVGGGRPQGFVHTLDYTYDRVHDRRTLHDSLGIANFNYTYDDLHRLTEVIDNANTARRWTYAYDLSGHLTSRTIRPANLVTTLAYDPGERLESVQVASVPTLELDFDYDAAGKLTRREQRLGGVPEVTTYDYDGADQLTRVMAGTAYGDNRVDRTHTYDAAQRLLSDGEYNYTYDFEGRLVQRVRQGSTRTDVYVWDAEDRLREHRQTVVRQGRVVTALEVRYCYDPLGRRIEKSVNGVVTRYVHDGDDLLHEVDNLNRVIRTYVHGPGVDDPAAVIDAVDGRTLHYLQGRLDTVVGLVDDAGNLVQSYVYDEFGQVLDSMDPGLLQAYGYTGRAYDHESGLYDYRARLYDPRVGRFLSEDPAQLAGGRNLYGYVLNDPVNANDPFGLAPGLACVNTCNLKWKTAKALEEPNACCEREKCKKKCQDQVDCVPYDCLYKTSPSCILKTLWRCFK